ncbi:hypothetical protein SAMN04487918_1011877 [Bacillus sp. bc15]|uniref:hypothetical protein n=1 Tax=Bacillus TaxID=1386 RepID=UPI000918B9B4|nr:MULTISPECIES: hypothetical protein [Bacillus]PGW74486.1 hypothetical protein COE21_21370 [Bacillus thuringiensis]SHL25283.1 hypothetical protein SAMN04487918_1011877 [Bacillus sp. bc15]
MQSLLTKVQLFCNSKFQDFNLVEEVLTQYQELKGRERAEIEYKMYVIYRGKFDNLFRTSQYSEAIYWFEKTKNHNRYSKELEDNKRNILISGAKTYFVEFLNSKNSKFLGNGKKLLKELELLAVDTIVNDETFKEALALQEAIEKNTIKTKVMLELPLAMKEATIIPITVQTSDFVANLNYVTNNPDAPNSGNVTKHYDKEGQMSSTIWSIEFNEYINYHKLVEVNADYQISILDEAICLTINTVINNYRAVSQEYWIKNIYPFMIRNKAIEYIAEGIPFINIPLLDNGAYTFSSEKSQVEIPKYMDAGALALYDLLLLDSQSYLLSGDFRESILSLNSAFENYIYTVVCPLIVEKSVGELDEKFYRRVPNYNDFDFKYYMTEENYQSALNEGLIREVSMSTFQIIKKLYDYCELLPTLISRSKMNRLINNIRKNRNDFIHGNKVLISTSYKEVSGQIEEYKKFKGIISNLMNL